MNTFRFAFKALGLFLFSVILQSTARAQPEQTYVSTGGSDAGNCPRAAPCRTIDYALSQVEHKGIVMVLKSGRYAAFTVNKSVSVVVAPGAYAEVVASTNAVTINQLGAEVVLRGLALRGANGGASTNLTNGVHVAGDDVQLSIENCIISEFNTSSGIYFSSTSGNLVIKDTTVRDCLTGMYISGGHGPTAYALIERCRVENNQIDGIRASNYAVVTVRDSIAANNAVGFHANPSDAKSPVTLMILEHCVVLAGEKTGVKASGNGPTAGQVYISDSTVVSGGVALSTVSDGKIFTRQNNTIYGPTGWATLIPFPAQ